MRNRRRHTRSSIEGLRLAIDCMPIATREAMLEGVNRYERIIVGAYVDDLGGVCPMLAAHRCGGRTDFLSFAKSWDRFARAGGPAKRAATVRELRILVSQLQDSLECASGLELDRAIAEHHELIARSRRTRRRLDDEADRSGRRDDADRYGRRDDEPDPRDEIRARRLRVRPMHRRTRRGLSEAGAPRQAAPVAPRPAAPIAELV
ncbi:MAG TPA: hypothetical protein VKG82_07005 [Solirubrobacteraceae bacterium]|nr:hypothetical protein [Solirubrobacteraceae bacterium]